MIAAYHLELAESMLDEHTQQVAFVTWCDWEATEGDLPELGEIFAVGNGGLRHPVVAQAMKAEGQRPGVSDLLLLVPRKSYAGLLLELKHPGQAVHGIGAATADQRAFLQRHADRGYASAIAFGVDAARAAALWYLGAISEAAADPGALCTHPAVGPLGYGVDRRTNLIRMCRTEVLVHGDIRLWRPYSARSRTGSAGTRRAASLEA